ncbi:MAG TPA: C10 family peptidase [Chitinophagaceae bacterium]|nr:C10 family peptidase [Chitinophagaceae bacterium]
MNRSVLWACVLLLVTVAFIYSCQKQERPNANGNNYKVNLIPEQLARALAKHFTPEMIQMNTQGANRSISFIPNRTITSSKVLVDTNNIPALYIYNYQPDSGYVVISADANHEPICAYIERGNAIANDSVPGALVNWFDKTIENIEILRQGLYDNTARANKAWCELLQATELTNLCAQLNGPTCIEPPPPPQGCGPDYYFQRGPLLQATWGQGCSYNEMCPSRNCTNICFNNPSAWTGCVATSMSQIIRYWHPANQYNYNYASMPNTFGNNEVQRLMRDCGLPENVNMNYGCSGSSAAGSRVPTSLKNNFGFSSAQRSNYVTSSYLTVKSNLDNNWPVFLEGCSKRKKVWFFFWKYSECHEWVTDGYISTGNNCYGYLYFHMNWGWHETWGNNDHNGWFAFNNWAIPGTSFNFQYAQDYTNNVHP